MCSWCMWYFIFFMYIFVLIRFFDKFIYEKEICYMYFKLILKLIDESILFLYIDCLLCVYYVLFCFNMGIYLIMRYLIKIFCRLKFLIFLCIEFGW